MSKRPRRVPVDEANVVGSKGDLKGGDPKQAEDEAAPKRQKGPNGQRVTAKTQLDQEPPAGKREDLKDQNSASGRQGARGQGKEVTPEHVKPVGPKIKAKNPADLLAKMAVCITGLPPTSDGGKTATYVLHGIRDSNAGSIIQYDGPPLYARKQHLDTLKSNPSVWNRFLANLPSIGKFFMDLTATQRAEWLEKTQQLKEQSLLQAAKSVDAKAKPTIQILHPGNNTQLVQKISSELLSHWIETRAKLPLDKLTYLLGESKISDRDARVLMMEMTSLDEFKTREGRSLSSRNLFFLHDWWSAVPDSTVILDPAKEIGKPMLLYRVKRSPATNDVSVEAADDLATKSHVTDTAKSVLLRCGDSVVVQFELADRKSPDSAPGEPPVADTISSVHLPAKLGMSELKSCLQKIIRFRPSHIQCAADLPGPRSVASAGSVGSAAASAGSVGSAAASAGSGGVSSTPVGGVPLVPSSVVLEEVVRALLRHRATYVPSLHQVVSGAEALCKRLAVVGFEDSCISPTDAEFLLVLALLARFHPDRILPLSETLTLRCVRIAQTLLSESKAYVYLTAARPRIELGQKETKVRATQETPPTKKPAKSKKAAVSPPHKLPFHRCSVLLDTLGSFDGDLNMVRDLAFKASTDELHYVSRKDSPVVMPIWHVLDQHCSTGVDLPYVMCSNVLNDQRTAPKLLSAPFGTLFDRVFRECTSFNSRRHDPKTFLETPLVRAVHEAQLRLWNMTTVSRSVAALTAKNVDKKNEKTVTKTFALDDELLRGAIGHIQCDRHLVVLETLDPLSWKVFLPPTREGHSKQELPEGAEKEAVEAKAMKKLTSGELKWHAFPAPFSHLRKASIRYQRSKGSETWFVDGKPWAEQKTITRTLKEVPLHVVHAETAEPSTLCVTNATQLAGQLFQDVWPVRSIRRRALGRLMEMLRRAENNSGRDGVFEFPKLSRTGEGCAGASTSVVDMPLFDDALICQCLHQLGRLFPWVLGPTGTADRHHTPRGFRIHASYGFQELYDVIDEALFDAKQEEDEDKAERQQGKPLTGAAGVEALFIPTSWPDCCKAGDGRDAKEHQATSLALMLKRDASGARTQFVWEDAGSGKTKIVGDYLCALLKGGRLGSAVVYTLPGEAVSSVSTELERFGFDIHVLSAAKKSKTSFRPFVINLVKHDDMRRMPEECFRFLQAEQSVLIVDEAHKTMAKTLRTQVCHQAAAVASRWVLLTGTPVIDSTMMGLIPWLQGTVKFPVTDQNIWCAALTGNAMIHQNPEWKVHVEKHIIKAPFTPEERKQYLQCMPTLLGGLNQQATTGNLLEGFRICEAACFRWLVQQVLPESLVFLKNVAQRDEFVKAWSVAHPRTALENGDSNAVVNDKKEPLLLSEGGIHVVDPHASAQARGVLPLTAQAIQDDPRLKQVRLVVALRQHNTGFSVSAWNRCYWVANRCQVSEAKQMLGRIRRSDNQHTVLHQFIVVDEMEVFLHRYRREQHAEAIIKAIDAALLQMKL